MCIYLAHPFKVRVWLHLTVSVIYIFLEFDPPPWGTKIVSELHSVKLFTLEKCGYLLIIWWFKWQRYLIVYQYPISTLSFFYGNNSFFFFFRPAPRGLWDLSPPLCPLQWKHCLNHWTTREFHSILFYFLVLTFLNFSRAHEYWGWRLYFPASHASIGDQMTKQT